MRNLTIAMLLTASTTASAATTHVLPGTMCEELGDDDAPVLYRSSGNLYNSDADGEIEVTCPVPHDLSTATTISLSVYVFDRNDGVDFDCTLKARTLSSDSETSKKTGATSGYSSSVKSISMSSLSVSSSSMVYFNCKIPRVFADNDSGIVGYKVTES